MSEEARRTLRYVESLSDARTPLVDFFSILLVEGQGFEKFRDRIGWIRGYVCSRLAVNFLWPAVYELISQIKSFNAPL